MTEKKPNVQRLLTQAEALGRRGEYDQARACLTRILERFAKNARARAMLADIDRREARAQRPDLTPSMIEGLIAARREGRHAEALDETALLCRAYPDEPVLFNLLASCRFDAGDLTAAERACRRALELAPDYPEAHFNLSIACRQQGRLKEALRHNRRAVELRPGYTAARAGLGRVLEMLGRADEAAEVLEEALRSDPLAHDALNNLGAVSRVRGDKERARTAFRRAIELRPLETEVYANLADLERFEAHDPFTGPLIGRMSELVERPDLDAMARFPLGFALAKALDDIGERDRSFAVLRRANAWRKEAFPYDLDDDRRLFAAIRDAYEAVETTALAAPSQGPRFVFIVGMPRSGSTLVEQILASHSRVYGAGEHGALETLMLPLFDGTGPMRGATVANLVAAAAAYRASFTDLDITAPVVTDKFLGNFRWTGFLLALFPDSRVINIRRDPVATCWSIFRRRFANRGNGFAYDLRDLAGYYRLYSDLMDYWAERAGDRFANLDYEDLVADQEGQTRRMLDFAGLGWEDACMSFFETRRAVRTASSQQVRQPIYGGSSLAWKDYERHLSPLIEALKES